MRITFFDAKSYDTESFDAIKANYPDLELEYWEAELNPKTAAYVTDSEAVCAFVNANAGADTLRVLASRGVKLLLMRCAGYNNVDLEAATANGIKVMRVPGYSPEAVAELAMTLASAVNRHIHKAYIRVRENNFSLQGLTGKNFYGKTAGIIGTGKIGAAMARICRGYGMRVLGYDKYPNKSLDFVEYVSLEQLLRESDLISLHCPLMKETYHMINIFTINQMKDGVILINTARGALIDSEALISGIEGGKVGGAALDVTNPEPLPADHRLWDIPTAIITPHVSGGWSLPETFERIVRLSADNLRRYFNGEPLKNVIDRETRYRKL